MKIMRFAKDIRCSAETVEQLPICKGGKAGRVVKYALLSEYRFIRLSSYLNMFLKVHIVEIIIIEIIFEP